MFADDLRTAGLQVTAVGSRTAESADRFAADYGIPTAHPSYQRLVDDPDVDVVYVATPHPMHEPDARLALEAGKHVLVEKPFTMTAAEAQGLAESAASRGLVLQEAMWTRFLPHMIRIRELVRSGALGRVRSVTADHRQSLPDDPEHRLRNPALGGGALLDLGIYPVSFASDVLGDPVGVVAVSDTAPTGVDAQTAVLLEHADGAHAILHCGLDATGPNRASVVGTEARLDIDPVWYTPTTATLSAPDGRVLERIEYPVAGRGMQYQASAVERAVSEGAGSAPELPIDETVRIMRTLDEIRDRIGLRYPGEGAGGRLA